LDFQFLIQALPRLLPGLWLTVQLSLVGLALAAAVGLPLGVLRARRPSGPAAWAIDGYVFFVRGTPILVQLYAAFFLLPMTGVDLSPFWVGIVALVFNSAGYQVEIARAAILSIDAGQEEAGRALGLRSGQALRLIVLPQAVARMWPALANEASNLVKASSVLSVIAVFELHKAANAIISQSYKFLEMLAAQALLYMAFVVTLTQLAGWLERRAGAATGLAETAPR
jgi:His/Glu/Gln/Arg/opine family amino acid ABC transporter permease subunit